MGQSPTTEETIEDKPGSSNENCCSSLYAVQSPKPGLEAQVESHRPRKQEKPTGRPGLNGRHSAAGSIHTQIRDHVTEPGDQQVYSSLIDDQASRESGAEAIEEP